MRKNQRGFGIVELLIIIIVIGLIIVVGWLVYDRQKTNQNEKEENSLSQQLDTSQESSKNETPEPAQEQNDPTIDWVNYTNPNGKFTLKYPKTWSTASNPELCPENNFSMGADKDSAGSCGTDNRSQINISWSNEKATCYELNPNDWNEISNEEVTISGISSVKEVVVARNQSDGLGSVPEGSKFVRYCLAKSDRFYSVSYIQLPNYPDVLSDFETMTIKTFRLN